MINLDFLSSLAIEAGKAILENYNTESGAEGAEDRSLLTLAEKGARQILFRGLRCRYPDIPVLSKEDKDVPYSTRIQWPRFWLVDPLSGEEEFIRRSDEFSVNMALIEGITPVAGVIYVPTRERLVLAAKGAGCWEVDHGVRRALKVSSPTREKPVRVVTNRAHPSPNMASLIDLLPRSVTLGRGGALAFCAIAANEADFYPCLDATWEWETAPGQVIVLEAGGVMTGLKGEPFTYNKPDLLNGRFLVAPSLAWLEEMDVFDFQEKLADSEFEFCVTSCR